jgi:pimeloyl-ACP methyl ester carboxylesterase
MLCRAVHLALLHTCAGWTSPAFSGQRPTQHRMSAVPPGVSELVEPAAIAAANAVEWTTLDLPSAIASGPVAASFVRTTHTEETPIVLLHSFDSSCLEWRRVLPLLEEAGLEAYALDSLGWGFADTRNVRRISVESKREHLRAFCAQQLGGRRAMLVGSSLGAATIIDFVHAYPEAASAVALVDPQGFIDGTPPVPDALARPGIQLLGSWPLRSLGQCAERPSHAAAPARASRPLTAAHDGRA